MTTNSYLEYYLTLLAWVINNSVWYLLLETAIFAIPLIGIVLNSWLESRQQGADEGNKGIFSLNIIETRLWVAYMIILFACQPILPIDLGQMKLDSTRTQTCGVSIAAPEDTAWGGQFSTIGDRSAAVPLWWQLIHSLSKGVSAAATASIPCTPDVREIVMEIQESKINNKVLLQEVAAFTNNCYGAARSVLFREMPDLTKEQDYDTSWIGSTYFLTQPGYYDTFRALTPQKRWPYDANRDEGLPNHGGGFPQCSDWWNAPNIGLRTQLVNEVDPTLMTRIKGWWANESEQAVQDETIRQLVSPKQQQRQMNRGDYYQAYGADPRGDLMGDSIGNAAAGAGVAWESLSYLPSMRALKTALPMLQSFVIMAIIISLPIAMLVSSYSLKALLTLSFGLFALHMLSFWWELARWIDTSMLKALYGDLSFTDKSLWWAGIGTDNNLAGELMRNLVMPTLFVILPIVFMAVISWVGMSLGSGLQTSLERGSASSAKGGGEAANSAKNKVR